MSKTRLLGFALIGALVFVPPSFATGQPETGGKPLEISWMTGYGSKADPGKNIIQNKVEQMFNVKVNITFLSRDDREKVDLLLASGSYPDVLYVWNNIFQLYSNGIIRGIPREYIQQYAPDHAKFLDARPEGWKLGKEPGKDNSYLALYGVDDTTMGTLLVPYYRLDWLTKVGITPHGTLEKIDDAGKINLTKQPFTIDELEKILIAFTRDDPDGNGKNDTYGMAPCDALEYAFSSIMGSFGFGTIVGSFNAPNGANASVDGKLTDWSVNPALKDFLILMSKWYKEGIIDPEFPTNTFNKMHEKLVNGKAGYWVANTDYAQNITDNQKQYAPGGIIANFPSATILIAPPESGTQGSHTVNYQGVTGLGHPFLINKRTSDEKVKKILQIFNWLEYGDGFWLTRIGVEGVNYKWEGTPFKSRAISLDPKRVDSDGLFTFYQTRWDQKYIDVMYGPIGKKLLAYFAFGDGAKFGDLYNYKDDLFGTTQFSTLAKKYASTLSTMTKEFIYKGITGEIDVAAQWDSYVSTWLKSGGAELEAELEKAPKVADLLQK